LLHKKQVHNNIIVKAKNNSQKKSASQKTLSQ
jgi:hypothetical protein